MIDSPIKNYNGAKGGNGVYQRIINKIPDAPVILIPFGGSGQIFRRLDHTRSEIYINDIDTDVARAWRTSSIVAKDKVFNTDFEDFIAELANPATFIYLDPPYLFDTRSCKNGYYKNEMTEADHHGLIDVLNNLKCNWLLSHPKCALYDQNLNSCSTEDFTYMSRSGKREDRLWWNYNAADTTLNTYDYLGDNYIQRQQIKRQRKNVLDKFLRMDTHTRDSILRYLTAQNECNTG